MEILNNLMGFHFIMEDLFKTFDMQQHKPSKIHLNQNKAKKLIMTLNLIRVHLTEGTVSEILKQENRVIGVSYKTKRQEAKLTAYAPLTIVVDGCASNFRKDLCENPTPVSNSKFYGLILKCQLPNPGYGHVILTHPGVLLAYTVPRKIFILFLFYVFFSRLGIMKLEFWLMLQTLIFLKIQIFKNSF